MYKNQLQELAQRSCFNLPSYSCIREGPDHAPRFKATVNFNGELFDCPNFCTTLRQAEHSAAEVALHSLSSRAPSHSLAARILDETGVYKNLLQEISQRVGASLPSYSTYRSGLGHLPVFTCTVELAGIIFTGEPAKNKKQAEKNAALAAWSSLKKLAQQTASSSTEPEHNDEQEQLTIARALLNYRLKEKMAMANNPNATPFPKKFPIQPDRRPLLTQPSAFTGSKILPLIWPNSTPGTRPTSPATNDNGQSSPGPAFVQPENRNGVRHQRFPAAGAAPYVPVRLYAGSRSPYHGMAPPVTIRTAVPCFSAPPLPSQTGHQLPPVTAPPIRRMAPPVHIRQAIPVQVKEPPGLVTPAKEPQQNIAAATKELQQQPSPEFPQVPVAAPTPAKDPTAAKVEELAIELPQANVVAPTKLDPPAKETATEEVPNPTLIEAMDSSMGNVVPKILRHLDLKCESDRV